jgi:hypothetical protein
MEIVALVSIALSVVWGLFYGMYFDRFFLGLLTTIVGSQVISYGCKFVYDCVQSLN